MTWPRKVGRKVGLQILGALQTGWVGGRSKNTEPVLCVGHLSRPWSTWAHGDVAGDGHAEDEAVVRPLRTEDCDSRRPSLRRVAAPGRSTFRFPESPGLARWTSGWKAGRRSGKTSAAAASAGVVGSSGTRPSGGCVSASRRRR